MRHLLKSSSITAHALQFSFLTVRHLQRTKYDFLPTKTKKGALEKNLRLNTKMNDNLLRQRGYKKTAFLLPDKDKAPNPIFNAMIICHRQENVLIYM